MAKNNGSGAEKAGLNYGALHDKIESARDPWFGATDTIRVLLPVIADALVDIAESLSKIAAGSGKPDRSYRSYIPHLPREDVTGDGKIEIPATIK